ncbi:MAG: GNAT family N-acetyltransferase [Clostridiaceae bacterium]|nr:GNAT family N-acetyltransferase [Clostridiaceae bacterium]
MIKYREGYEIDYIRLIELFEESNQQDISAEYMRLVSMVESSALVVTAWDFDYMIGFARLTCDEAIIGNVNNVMVDNEYRNMGIEEELINFIISSNPQVG